MEFETRDAAEKCVNSTYDVSSYGGSRLSFWFSTRESSFIEYPSLGPVNYQDQWWPDNTNQFNSVQTPNYNYSDFNNNDNPDSIYPEYAKNQTDLQSASQGYYDFGAPYTGKNSYLNTPNFIIFQEMLSSKF